jgi:hypothetical protein
MLCPYIEPMCILASISNHFYPVKATSFLMCLQLSSSAFLNALHHARLVHTVYGSSYFGCIIHITLMFLLISNTVPVASNKPYKIII